jgi:hypothetical protein
MRWTLLLSLLVIAGCAQPKTAANKTADDKTTPGKTPGAKFVQGEPRTLQVEPAPGSSDTNKPGMTVTPSAALTGKIMLVNANARYVVITYPVGRLPDAGQRLQVYRKSLKIGEVKITGPQKDLHTVADVLTGECQVGDEVKED